MRKRIIASLLLITLILTAIPLEALAGENTDAVMELSRKSYILDLIGSEDGPEYRSGALLSANMNAKQMEDCLEELLSSDIEGVLCELEDLVTYGERSDTNEVSNRVTLGDYGEAVKLLDSLRQIWMEAKGCKDIISEDRDIIASCYEALEAGDVFTTEHERESLAHKIIEKADDLEKQMAYAADCYSTWKNTMKSARNRLVAASSPTAVTDVPADELQNHIVTLKTGRAAEMKSLASKEPNSAGKDIVIDVVSIHEIRIYALDENKQPLKDAVIYCWNADESITDPKRGTARFPNEEGYVTVPISELGADENHYLTAGYEVSCPGYRTQYAQANYILGGEIFWCYLQENDPKEDVYVAGISLNGYDCKWYEKELYITDENTADQTVTLFLRSQSGSDFSGTAEMKYKDRFSGDYSKLYADYSSSRGAATATFKSKLCQNVAVDQENAMTFNLSTSTSNAEITPTLKSEEARLGKTQCAKDDALINSLYFGKISLAFPGDVPFLNSIGLNFDVPEILKNHVFLLTNCSGLWAVFATTGPSPMTKSIEKLNSNWMTSDSKRLDNITKTMVTENSKWTKQQIEQEYKTARYDNNVPGLFGGKKIYGNASFVVSGTYDLKEMDFTAIFGLQVGFRGDWTKQFLLGGVVPATVGWGFDVSASTFFKFKHKGWDFDGVDINFDFRLMGYMSGGPGIRMNMFGKRFTVALGFKFQLALLLSVPIFTSATGPKDDPTFTFNIGLSFFADILFVHFTWNIWSGTGILNIRTKDFEFHSKPFWSKASSAEPLTSASGLALGESDGLGTTMEEEIHLQDDINGDTQWPYNIYGFANDADAAPTYFTVHWEGSGDYKSDSDYIFWVEDGKSVKFTATNYDNPVEQSFNIPADVQKHLDDGDWRITGVRAASDSVVYNVPVREFDHDEIQKVQLATVTVTIGTGWETVSEQQGDETITQEVPTGTVTVTRVFLYKGSMSQLQYPGDDNKLHDVVFVNQLDVPISDALGMIYIANLDGWSSPYYAQIEEDVVLIPSSAKPVVTLGTLDSSSISNALDATAEEDKANGWDVNNDLSASGLVYFTCGDLSGDIVPAVCRGGGLPDGKPVKMLTGGDGSFGFEIVLMEDGSLWYVSADRAYSEQIIETGLADNMGDIAIVRTDYDEENRYATYTLFCTPKAEESYGDEPSSPLQSVVLECDNGYYYGGEVTDYDVDLNGAPIFAGRIMNESYLYWFETFEDEETGENRTAVQGMCYSPKYNMMTSPYRLGVLKGSDGTAPDGFIAASAPLCSQVMSNGDMIITKAWLSDAEEGETDAENVLSTYKVNVVRRVANDLMGAGTENPAVSAGRDTNMLFTILNKGNVPILGFDFNIYHKNSSGEKELVQTSHVDVTDQSKNKVTFLRKGYSATSPAVFTGEYSARRTPGLFDMINGDEWNITRFNSSRMNGSGSIFVSIPALMPEGIQTYTMVFAVPMDWENKTEITCEIDKTYVPKYVADVFSLSEETETTAEERSQMPVLAVAKSINSNGLLAAGEGAPADVALAGTMENFSEKEPSSLAGQGGLLSDEYGMPMTFTYSPALKDVEFDAVNLSIKCRVFDKNGEKYVTITVTQEGQTDNVAPRGVTLQSFVDEEDNPSFAYTFKTHHDDGQMVYSMTLPEKTLTNGRCADYVKVTVTDTVEDNEEVTEFDDVCLLELNETLKITSQPESTTVKEGENAEFSVEVAGGQQPYKYTWQKLEDGKWVDIKGGDEATLVLKKVKDKMDGMVIRCVIEDAAEGRVVSDSVTLTVKTEENPIVPDTGDHNNTSTWILITVLSFLAFYAGLVFVRKKRED
ncbi:MAG: immunoglobulin domain-containing protein [Lachnospiraceae bacterium]|nr:immunoglobulin domain-containing protein [Lachnospiraceae bacterium]